MTEAAQEREFKTLMDVLRFLQGEGFQIEKSKLYTDRDAGLIRYEKRHPISETEVWAYVAKAELSKEDGGPGNSAAHQLEKDNAAKRVLLLESMRRKNRLLALKEGRERGQLVDRGEVDLMLVGILQVVDSSAKQMMDRVMVDLSRIVGGDGTKTNAGREFLRKEWDAMMHRLSRTDAFEVKYLVENEADEHHTNDSPLDAG